MLANAPGNPPPGWPITLPFLEIAPRHAPPCRKLSIRSTECSAAMLPTDPPRVQSLPIDQLYHRIGINNHLHSPQPSRTTSVSSVSGTAQLRQLSSMFGTASTAGIIYLQAVSVSTLTVAPPDVPMCIPAPGAVSMLTGVAHHWNLHPWHLPLAVRLHELVDPPSRHRMGALGHQRARTCRAVPRQMAPLLAPITLHSRP